MPGQLEEGVPENGLKLAQVHLRRAASMKVIRVSSGNSSRLCISGRFNNFKVPLFMTKNTKLGTHK